MEGGGETLLKWNEHVHVSWSWHTQNTLKVHVFSKAAPQAAKGHIAYSVNINNNKQTPKKSGVIAEIRVITKTSFSAVIVKNVEHDFSLCCMNWKRFLVGCAFIRQNVPFFSKYFLASRRSRISSKKISSEDWRRFVYFKDTSVWDDVRSRASVLGHFSRIHITCGWRLSTQIDGITQQKGVFRKDLYSLYARAIWFDVFSEQNIEEREMRWSNAKNGN